MFGEVLCLEKTCGVSSRGWRGRFSGGRKNSATADACRECDKRSKQQKAKARRWFGRSRGREADFSTMLLTKGVSSFGRNDDVFYVRKNVFYVWRKHAGSLRVGGEDDFSGGEKDQCDSGCLRVDKQKHEERSRWLRRFWRLLRRAESPTTFGPCGRWPWNGVVEVSALRERVPGRVRARRPSCFVCCGGGALPRR
jgi:hypothetical protein